MAPPQLRRGFPPPRFPEGRFKGGQRSQLGPSFLDKPKGARDTIKPLRKNKGECMEQVLLVRYGEIHLKGLNRPFFEQKLIQGIKNALRDLSLPIKVRQDQGRIYVFGVSEEKRDEAVDRLSRVFGIHGISPAVAVDKAYPAIESASP